MTTDDAVEEWREQAEKAEKQTDIFVDALQDLAYNLNISLSNDSVPQEIAMAALRCSYDRAMELLGKKKGIS